MKTQSTWAKIARFFGALVLYAIGAAAFLVSVLLLFGWLFPDRSWPPQTVTRTMILSSSGVVVLACSSSCFFLGRRLMKSLQQ